MFYELRVRPGIPLLKDSHPGGGVLLFMASAPVAQ